MRLLFLQTKEKLQENIHATKDFSANCTPAIKLLGSEFEQFISSYDAATLKKSTFAGIKKNKSSEKFIKLL